MNKILQWASNAKEAFKKDLPMYSQIFHINMGIYPVNKIWFSLKKRTGQKPGLSLFLYGSH